MPGGSSPGSAVDYGIDVSTYPDLDDTFSPLTGFGAIAQAVARSLEDARRGVDLRQWLNEGQDAAGLWRLQSSIEARCLEDSRVAEASTEVTLSAAHELRVVISLVAFGLGPFRLVLKVSEVSVELLSVES